MSIYSNIEYSNMNILHVLVFVHEEWEYDCQNRLRHYISISYQKAYIDIET